MTICGGVEWSSEGDRMNRYWVILTVLTAIVLVGLVLNSGTEGKVDAQLELFDQRQETYLGTRDPLDRSSLLEVGDQLASAMAKGEVSRQQASDIQSRLDLMLRMMGLVGMSARDLDLHDRINFAVSTRQAQQAQIETIDGKR